jgi:AGZA family xanthine/uracil permease-like MFS transporter
LHQLHWIGLQLINLILVVNLKSSVCAAEVDDSLSMCEQAIDDIVRSKILPGLGLTVLLGNLYFTFLAGRMMARTRQPVTALPLGVNTLILISWITFIITPVYQQAKARLLEDAHAPQLTAAIAAAAAQTAWEAALLAAVQTSLIEAVGAVAVFKLRALIPPAAMLSALAGVSISFIALNFSFTIFATPAVGVVPMMVLLVSYAS